MNKTMPTINVKALNCNDEEMKIVNLIVKPNGTIRSTKPKVIDTKPETGKAAYVWRMVAFQVSKNNVHHCLPVTATFDLPAFDENNKWCSSLADKMAKQLKSIEDAIVNQVPKNEWFGINRWGKALGY